MVSTAENGEKIGAKQGVGEVVLAEERAQGEVAGRVEVEPGVLAPKVRWLKKPLPPAGALLYTAPPAPSVPERWRLESKRLLPLLQSFADRLANHGRSGIHSPELYEADHDTLMESIGHLKQIAAAPEQPCG